VTSKAKIEPGNYRWAKIVLPDYLEYIRVHPCANCGARQVDAHHLKPKGTGSSKRNDFTAVPLCRECHSKWHNGEELLNTDLWRDAFYYLLAYHIATMSSGMTKGKSNG